MADPKKKTSVQAEIIFFVLIVAILFVFFYHYAFADETQTNEITGNQNTINFGWWGNDERHDYTLQGIDIFEQKNPSINVNCTYSVWSGYERRNRIYMRSGSEPDVMQINYNWISEYSPGGNGYYNLYDLSDEEKKKIKGLPKSMGSAIKALEKDHKFLTEGGVFPEKLIEIWIQNKREDLKMHIEMPTPAEFDMYYDL